MNGSPPVHAVCTDPLCQCAHSWVRVPPSSPPPLRHASASPEVPCKSGPSVPAKGSLPLIDAAGLHRRPQSSDKKSTGTLRVGDPAPSASADDSINTDDLRSGDAKTIDGLIERITRLKAQLDESSFNELRKALLKSRFGVESPPSLSHKQFCITVTPAVVAGGTITEIPIALSAVSIGSGVNQRIGYGIRAHSVRVKAAFHFYQGATVNTAQGLAPPQIKCMLFREKVPLTLGTPPTMMVAGVNPPGGSAYYSNLGTALTVRGYLNNSMRDPVVGPMFHAYKDENIPNYRHLHNTDQTSVQQVYVAGTTSQVGGAWYHIDWIVPLHGLELTFSLGNNNPELNALYFVIIPDTSGNQSLSYTLNTSFYYTDSGI